MINDYMILLYLKQSWNLIRQNKLYSSVYILGTGLALSLVMVLTLIYYIKLAPVYPEIHRDRTLVYKSMCLNYPKTDSRRSSALSFQAVKNYFYPLKSVESVSAIGRTSENFLELPATQERLSVQVKQTDAAFWQVFGFRFVAGQPFTQEEFQSGIRSAVICESLAKKLFGTSQAAGQYFSLDADEYRVSGVVKDVSFATPVTFAQIWIPFTVFSDYVDSWMDDGMTGGFEVYMLAPSIAKIGEVKEEIHEIFHKLNAGNEEYQIELVGQPDVYWKSTFRVYTNVPINWKELFKTQGWLLFALLLVPAVNLAGLISSRMDKRLPELGLRKAFGASRRSLLQQLLTENLLLTSLGGMLGLIIAYFLVWRGRNWLLTVFESWPDKVPEGVDTFLTPAMLFNPTIILLTFAVCFVLNFFAAVFPALRGMNRDIVSSLHDK